MFIYVIFHNVVLTSQRTQSVLIIKNIRLMLLKKIMAVYCDNHTQHISRPKFCGKAQFLNVTVSGTYTYHVALKD